VTKYLICDHMADLAKPQDLRSMVFQFTYTIGLS
jgi:hypothetical protein